MPRSSAPPRDDLGPYKTLRIHDPARKLEAFLVVDNTWIGPGIGGVRMAADVSEAEVGRLARAMTLKCAAAGLPFGGGKVGIVANPKMSDKAKEQVIRALARALRDVTDYIPGPDMGTDERCMAWIHDENGRAVGLPRVLGGIPLDEIGATGHGLAAAATVAAEHLSLSLDGARVVVQGFGAVGQHAARVLAERGARLIATADTGGGIRNADGLPIDELRALKASGRSVNEFPGGERISPEQLLATECEIWIPAARPDVVNAENVDTLRTRIFLQGANIPATARAEERLQQRGILNVPDFIANAGGLICAVVEYGGGTEQEALRVITETVTHNTREMLARATSGNVLPRAAATQMARERVLEAGRYRRTG